MSETHFKKTSELSLNEALALAGMPLQSMMKANHIVVAIKDPFKGTTLNVYDKKTGKADFSINLDKDTEDPCIVGEVKASFISKIVVRSTNYGKFYFTYKK